jgi:hypothetical protein
MSIPVLVDLDLNSVSRIINSPDPTLGHHVVNKTYVDAIVEGLAWKDNVRVATQGNINLTNPGTSTIDGVALSANDRVLVRNQSTAAENGIYIFNASGTPMTRAADMSVSAEFTNAIVPVDGGTDAGTQWRQTAVAPTVGSTAIVFSAFGTSAPSASESSAGIIEIATQAEVNAGTDTQRAIVPAYLANWSGRKLKHSQTFGDGSATSYPISHNLGTRDVHVAVYRNSGNYDEVMCDIERTDANTVTLKFAVAPTTNQLRTVILG